MWLISYKPENPGTTSFVSQLLVLVNLVLMVAVLCCKYMACSMRIIMLAQLCNVFEDML